MIRRYLIVLVGLCLCLACFGLDLEAAQAVPESIKVSSVLSLTGVMAASGSQLKAGYEIFAEQINASGGIYVKEYDKKLPLELRVLDDESDGLKTQAQLEVANSWGAVANLGGIGCSSFEMGTPIAQKNKMVWIGVGCGGWMPHQLGNKWLFSVFMKTPFFSTLVFDMLDSMAEPAPKKIAIFEINQLDCQETALYWRQAAQNRGYAIVFDKKYPAGTRDFSALITGAKAAGAEILLAYPIPPMGPTIVKQMKELDFSPKLVYWVRAPATNIFGPSLGPLSDYICTPVSWSNQLNIPGNEYINKKHMEMYGRPGDPVVGDAYAAAQVMAAAIKNAGTLDRTAVRDAVAATDMETVVGRIRFSDQGWAEDRLLLVVQWMGGKLNIVHYNEAGKEYRKFIPTSPLRWQKSWSER
jgi:branched-chain amino acid transport system substrate-binding protein